MNCQVDVQCTSVPNATPDTDITYTLGSPSDSVTVKVVKVCDANQACFTDAAGIAAALPPNWLAIASGGTVTVYSCSSTTARASRQCVFSRLTRSSTSISEPVSAW